MPNSSCPSCGSRRVHRRCHEHPPESRHQGGSDSTRSCSTPSSVAASPLMAWARSKAERPGRFSIRYSRTSIWANSDRRPVRLTNVPDPRIAPLSAPDQRRGPKLSAQHPRQESVIRRHFGLRRPVRERSSVRESTRTGWCTISAMANTYVRDPRISLTVRRYRPERPRLGRGLRSLVTLGAPRRRELASCSTVTRRPDELVCMDSPLEGHGFELEVPRHESRGFPKHPDHRGRL